MKKRFFTNPAVLMCGLCMLLPALGAAQSSLSVAPTSLTVPATGDANTITVTSNVNWTVAGSETWLTVSPTSGNNNGPFTVTIDANTTISSRTATVTVSGDGGVAPQIINVTQDAATPTLSVDIASHNFVAEGGTISVNVTSNVNWTIASSDTWLTVSPTSGSDDGVFDVEAEANTTTSSRTATVTVSGDGGVTPQTINVTQDAAPPALSVDLTSLDIAIGSGTETVSITSNVNWTVASSDTWLTVSPASGTGDQTLTFTATANSTGASRTATVTVTDGGSLSETITVTQAGPTLSVAPTTLTIPAAGGGSTTITVTANINWTATASATWLTGSGTGSGDGSFTVTATANTAIASRAGYVTVCYDTDNSIADTVWVTQDGAVAVLSVAPDTYSFGTAGGTTPVTVTANIGWTAASSDVSWLTISPAIGSGDDVITLTATANMADSARAAIVVIDGGGLRADTVYVVQGTSAAPVLNVMPTSLTLPVGGCLDSIFVISNIGWTAVSSETWLTVSPGMGVNRDTLTLAATINPTTSPRTATITVSSGALPARTVSITQVGPSLIVTPMSLNFDAASSSDTLTITSNIAYLSTSSASWLSVARNGNKVIVTVNANLNNTPRTATITVAGHGLLRTVYVTQEAASVLTVGSASLSFATAGGSQGISVSSNTTWTASNNASWLTVAPASGSNNGSVSVTAVANTGYARTDTVFVICSGIIRKIVVTQAAAQQIIVEPTPPTNHQGSLEVAFEIPQNELSGVTFTLALPAGFMLDTEATSLVAELASRYNLTIVPANANSWTFSIALKTALRDGDAVTLTRVLNIVYRTNSSVAVGNYEIKFQQVNVTLINSSTVIHQDEIKVPIRITITGNTPVDAVSVAYVNGVLTVNTLYAEQVAVYSFNGATVYRAQKEAGTATFSLGSLPKGAYIVRGSSGWVCKIRKN